MSIEQRAKEFIERKVKKLPMPVQLNGITKAEKDEAASICTEFALTESQRKDQVIAELVKVARDSKGFIRAQNFDGKHSESTCSCTICDMIKDVQVVIERAEKELKEQKI